ncbi:MAG TPA: transposase [Chloroflexota bacterium]
MSSAASDPSPGLFPEPAVPPAGLLFGRGLRLIHDAETRRYGLYLGALVLDSWSEGDGPAQRLAIARLVNGKLAGINEVAYIFRIHRNTVARIGRQVEAKGASGALPGQRGPRDRHKVTRKVLEVLRTAVAAGWSGRVAQGEVRRRTGVQLSRGYTQRLMQEIRAQRPQPLALPLPALESESAPTATEQETASQSSHEHEAALAGGLVEDDAMPEPGRDLAPGEVVHSQYLGLTLFYAALEVTGLLPLAQQVYQLPGLVRFGVRQVFWELFCLALLQEPTIERVKHLLRTDLGAVLGRERAACVKTLRRKLAVLSEQGQAAALGLLLAKHWLEVGLLNASYLYVDGHMKLYHGKRAVQHIWNSQRRMPLPGIEQYFVNDLRGRPLLVVSQDVSGNLAKSLPTVIAAVRKVLGDERRLTVIFDRGGYDSKLFTWLVEQHIDFITYQRGEVALDEQQFHRHEVRWEGKPVRFWIAEDCVAVGDSGPWRRIVLRTADGHQTPILTSLTEDAVEGARVTALMLARWRQENFFKYARSHLGLDVLTSYAADPVPDRQVPNPEIKATKKELQRLQATARKVRAALGQTMVLEAARDARQTSPTDETATPTPATSRRRNTRTAHTRETLLANLQAIDADIAKVKERLTGLPQQVAFSSLAKPGRDNTTVPRLEPKLIGDTVKIAAYNAQSWLADRLAPHYRHANDRHDLLRAFAHLSGTMTRQLDGTLHISLDSPDLPIQCRALEGLCQELNTLQPHFPGTDIKVTYAVTMHHPGTVT